MTDESPKPSDPAPPIVLAPTVSIDHTIELDLQVRRQRHKLAKRTLSKFRIVGLDGCHVPYDIRPPDGRIDEQHDAIISIDGPREVTLRIAVAAAADESPVISIEAEAVNDVGDKIPFTMPNIKRIRGQIVKEGKRASAELDSMYEERDRLQSWMAAPGVKPLAARGQARVRVTELGSAIPPLESLVKSLRADLALADEMEELAAHLNRDCRVQISNGH
jgi:hypothetical protein